MLQLGRGSECYVWVPLITADTVRPFSAEARVYVHKEELGTVHTLFFGESGY
jgi:hypothetical protein